MDYEKIILEVKKLNISGNVVPIKWFKTIRRESKDGIIGKPYLLAINILSDIVYWYRPKEVRDELTGDFIRYEKRFKADMLQRSYKQISELFGCSNREAIDAIIRLEKIGVIKRHFRTIRNDEFVANNVLFIELIPSVLENLTYLDTPSEAISGKNLPTTHGGDSPVNPGEGPTPKRGRVPQIDGGQIQRIQTENTNRDYIYNNDHFSQNDRVSMNADKEENLDFEKNQVCDVTDAINEKNPVLSANKSNSDNKKAPRVNEKLEFDKLWALYPRKQGKKGAYAAFTRARKSGVALDTISSGIKAYVHYIDSKKISQEYIKQGSTFFNQNSWDDDWSLPTEYSFYNSKPNYDIEAYERSNRDLWESTPAPKEKVGAFGPVKDLSPLLSAGALKPKQRKDYIDIEVDDE